MASPFLQAWTIIKSRTYRNQKGTLGYGLPAISEQKPGKQKQPNTEHQYRQRVPLVGADRVDEFHAERGDHSGNPSINRRAAERASMDRNLAREAASVSSMGVPTESEGPSMFQMLFGQGKERDRQLADEYPFLGEPDEEATPIETGHPMEIAFRLLKNAMDYGEIAGELPEPNPLDAALARARNQGPAPGANLKRLPPKPHFTEGIKQFMAQNPDAPGNQPLGQPVPPPMLPQ